jgi:hydrogenase expression/formation protein HypC
MCLAVPGKVLDCDEMSGMREGRVQFAGIVRRVRLDFVPEAQIGDYVIVHVGFAISRVDTEEAERTLALLSEMGAVADSLGLEDEEDGEGGMKKESSENS